METTPLLPNRKPSITSIRGCSKILLTFRCCFCTALIMLVAAILLTTIFYSSDTPRVNSEDPYPEMYNTTWPIQDMESGTKNETVRNVSSIADVNRVGLSESVLQSRIYGGDLPKMDILSPSYRHQMTMKTTEKARELANYGLVMEMGMKEELRKGSTNSSPMRFLFPNRDRQLPDVCDVQSKTKCPPSMYRSPDGTCNNLDHAESWGVALQPFRRILRPDYADGISTPRTSTRSRLPSARQVSLKIHRPLYVKDLDFTVMLAVWGQFIDHDMTATALSQGANGEAISCCQIGRRRRHPECFEVVLDEDDPMRKASNVSCMNFVRSAPAPLCSGFGPREQLNQATSFIDGSVIYGNTKSTTDELRLFKGGQLKMLMTPEGEELLPVSTDLNDGCNRAEQFKRGRYCFLTGDLRSNENLHLISMHLIFARHHNEIAKKLSDLNPHWDDEKLFQESRKIVGAQLQHVTYAEFLPAILPDSLMRYLNLSVNKDGYFQLYDPSVNPTIANVFAASAFRFGHSLLPGLIKLISNDSSSEEYVELHKMLFNPFGLYDRHFLEKIMRGALNTSSERSDAYFSREVTEKLFQEDGRGKPCGLDLVSLNIQRGRDHGLPGYSQWRIPCGLEPVRHFDQLQGIFDTESLNNVRNLYGSVEDIDIFTGGLAEIPLNGSLLGPTFTCLIADQFLRLKIGDKYWYENEEKPQAFSPEQLKELKKTSLSRIICDNTGIDHAQPFVMRRVGVGNDRKPCDELSSPNLDFWKES